MRRLFLYPIAILAVMIMPAPLQAQASAPVGVEPGRRVRVRSLPPAADPVDGDVESVTGDSLTLVTGRDRTRVSFPITSMSTVEVSDGHDRFRTMAEGGLLGLVGGALVGAAALGSNPLERFIGLFIGASIGAPIGTVVGGVIAPEQWRVMWTRQDRD